MPGCMCTSDWKFDCSPRFEGFLSTPGGPSHLLFHHHTRLPQLYPEKACPVAYGRARAAGVGA